MEEDVIQDVLVPSDLAGTKILNEESYTRLLLMLNSKDKADHTMAQAILNQLDVENSIYWIWKLAREGWSVSTKMVYLRTKASRKFRDDCKLFEISQMDETLFAAHLDQIKWLTSEIFMKLKQEIIKAIIKRNTSDFYNFSITLKKEFEDRDTDNQRLMHLTEE